MKDRLENRSNCRGIFILPKNIKKTCEKVLTFVSRFLCVRLRIATISKAMEMINCNSSYVLIETTSFRKVGN